VERLEEFRSLALVGTANALSLDVGTRARIAALALVSATGLMGHNGGCHPDEGQPLGTPVSALALVLEDDGAVSAELIVVSTALDQQQRVDVADGVLLGPGDVSYPLERVEAGRYLVADLEYEATEPYAFQFSIAEEAASAAHVFAGSFQLAMHGVMDVPTVELGSDSLTVGESLALDWSPAGLVALVEVRDPSGDLSYRNFDVSRPLDYASWSGLPDSGELVIEPQAFGEPGAHEIRLCAVEVSRRDDEPSATPQHLSDGDGVSGGLGSLSGMLVGRCRRLPLSVEPP
jgi:hypothetical protein